VPAEGHCEVPLGACDWVPVTFGHCFLFFLISYFVKSPGFFKLGSCFSIF
jgi:hypothetical protein